MKENTTFWGEFPFDMEATRYWRVGSLELWVRRTEREWRIAHHIHAGEEQDLAWQTKPVDSMPENYSRFAFQKAPHSLLVQPALPRLPLVASLEKPFFLAPRNELYLHISSPIWLQLQTESPRVPLADLPVIHLSDTWFGPNTLDGDICLAATKFAHLDLKNVTWAAHRALTSACIRNNSDRLLEIGKIRIPLPHLPLFQDGAGRFWTGSIRFEMENQQDMAHMHVPSVNPFAPKKLKRVADERVKEPNMMVRAFSFLLSKPNRRSE